MNMKSVVLNPKRKLSSVNPMIYGQFIEHFHRQIYGGVYDPESEYADEDGFRVDVLEALRRIRVPILRWPGGCFVSAYHWKDGVGKDRIASYNKAWRVPEPNTFGTDEYIKLCRKIGCEPYICTNAGTGTAEEMSDWVEYCNLQTDTKYARLREANGMKEPYHVRYWSIGNENYGHWEIGSKTSLEWGRFVAESAKMMRRTDPHVMLSAAALNDMDWNANLLRESGKYLNWISIHGYWDFHKGKNELADYDQCISYVDEIEKPVRQVRGLLSAFDCEHIRIAYDEWNLRAWYHPNIMDLYQGMSEEEYLTPRDENDRNEQYTMADAVFSACFLNMCIWNSDIIDMAAFSPAVNTRGLIYTHERGIVLRSTWHVFDLYVNELQPKRIDLWCETTDTESDDIDMAATANDEGTSIAIAIVNKSATNTGEIQIRISESVRYRYRLSTVNGPDTDSYNSVNCEQVKKTVGEWINNEGMISVTVSPHSVNVLNIETRE